jgi:hypothetical protein
MIQHCLAHHLEDYCDNERVKGLDIRDHREDRVAYKASGCRCNAGFVHWEPNVKMSYH